MNLEIDKLSQSEEGRIQIMSALDKIQDQNMYKTQEFEYWKHYHSMVDDNQYDYLRKVGNFEFPALVRNIPHQRTFLNLLTSTQARRPWVFSVYTCDLKSQEKKYEDRLLKILDMFKTATTKKMLLSQEQITILDQKYQQIMQVLQVEPGTEEEAMQQQNIKQMLPRIQTELAMAKEVLTKEIMLSTQDLEKINRFFKYSYKDIKDELAQYIVFNLKRILRIHKKSIQNFIAHTVTGRQYFYVDYCPGDKYPIFEKIDTLSVSYPNIENVEWVQDGPFCKIEQYWTYNDILKKWGDRITPEQRKLIKNKISYSVENGAFVPTNENNAVYIPSLGNTVYSKSSGGIKVTRYFWIAEKQIKAIKKVNKKVPGKYFTHFVTDKNVISAEDYTYNNRLKKWVSKGDPNVMFDPKDVDVLNPSDGDKYIVRFMDERYDGVNIGDVVRFSYKSEVQLRTQDNFQSVKLPIVGRTFNGITDQPYSLIGSTMALSETINILYYHRELLLALTNVAGVVLDYSQKPAHMSKEEWYYQMKLGRYIIETIRDGKQVSSYNQFQTVNGGVHQSIQYIDNMINTTYGFMGEIMGIPRQRKGEVAPSDQVGTFERSIDQSNLITEIIFDDHDTIVAKAIEQVTNLYTRYCLPKNDNLTIGGKDMQLITIDPKMLQDVDLECVIEDDGKAERDLQEMKAIFKQGYDTRQIPLSQFMQVYISKSVKEVEKLIIYFAEEAEANAAKAMEAQNNAEMQKEAASDDRKAQYELKLEEMRQGLERQKMEFQAQLEQMKAQMSQQLDAAKLQIENRKLDLQENLNRTQNNLKLMELLNEQQIETSLLAENRDARLVSNKLEALALQMEALFNGVSLELQQKSTQLQHKEKMKKIDVDIEKAKKMNKEHVSDK